MPWPHVNNEWICKNLQKMLKSFFYFDCSFVWGLSSHLKNFTYMDTSPLTGKSCKIWSKLGTHGYWAVRGFFSVPYLLWHGISVNNGHFQGPVTLTPNAERLAMELPNYLRLSLLWFQHLLSACGTNALTDCNPAAHAFWWNICILICDLDVYFYSVCGMKSSRSFFLLYNNKPGKRKYFM